MKQYYVWTERRVLGNFAQVECFTTQAASAQEARDTVVSMLSSSYIVVGVAEAAVMPWRLARSSEPTHNDPRPLVACGVYE